MKNLIPMTDFVLQEANPSNTDTQFTDKLCAYANFLKQPLKLWMFVPCDEDGNVLEEPDLYYTWLYLHNSKGSTSGFLEHEKYQKAKEKCLFEGFETGFIITINKVFSAGNLIFDQEETIENLLEYKNKTFKLTHTSLKQIGL